jgi:hypothetical protein
VYQQLLEDVLNTENAKLILILKEMAVEVSNAEFHEAKERSVELCNKFLEQVEVAFGDALDFNNMEKF